MHCACLLGWEPGLARGGQHAKQLGIPGGIPRRLPATIGWGHSIEYHFVSKCSGSAWLGLHRQAPAGLSIHTFEDDPHRAASSRILGRRQVHGQAQQARLYAHLLDCC